MKKYALILALYLSIVLAGLNNVPPMAFAQLVPSMLLYENPTFGIQMRYPQDWTIDQKDYKPEPQFTDIVTFSIPLDDENDDYYDYLSVVEDNINSQPDLTQYVEDTINAYRDAFEDFELINSNTNLQLAGFPAYSITFTYTGEAEDNQFDLQVMEVGAAVGNKVYYFYYEAETDSYSRFLPTVEAMINSVQFSTPGEQGLQQQPQQQQQPPITNNESGLAQPQQQPTDSESQPPLSDGNVDEQQQQPSLPQEEGTQVPQTEQQLMPPSESPMGSSTPSGQGSMLYQSPFFSITYPSSWELTDNGTFPIVIGAPLEGPNDLPLEGIRIDAYDKLANETLELFVADQIDFRSIQLEGGQLIESKPFGRLGADIPSHYVISQGTHPELGPIMTMDVIATTEDSLYAITYFAEESQYTKYLPTILNMLNTFDIANTNSNQTQQAPELPPRELGTDL